MLGIEDKEDKTAARHNDGDSDKPFWKSLGPGLITGAAGDDPSGIGTYSLAGAQFGYSLLWLTPLCIPFMIAAQEMSGRIGRVCGCGLASVLKDNYPRYVLIGTLVLLITANIFNIFADLNVMAASANMLFGGNSTLWLVLLTSAIVLGQVLIPYRNYVRVLKWLSISLLAYVVTVFIPGVKNEWSEIGHNLVIPNWSWDSKYLMMIVGYVGTTISPFLFFWQAGEEVEEEIAEGKADAPGQRKVKVTSNEIQDMRIDTGVGMFMSQIITFFIIICAAATLHSKGITEINSAQDAASALLPLGKPAYWIFTLGILGTGLLAIPTLAGSVGYALSETFDWRYGLYRRFNRARAFYGSIAAMIVLGFVLNFVQVLSPVKALFYSAIINGIVTIPLLVVLMLVCNNRKIIKDRVNGIASNILGAILIILMTFCLGFMSWSIYSGQS